MYLKDWNKLLSATTLWVGFLQSKILPGVSSYTRADSNLCTHTARGKRMVLDQAITKQTHLSAGFLLPWCSWPNFHGLHKQLPWAPAAPRPVPWCGQGCAGCAPSVHVRSREIPQGHTKLGACVWHTRDRGSPRQGPWLQTQLMLTKKTSRIAPTG